MYSVGVHRTSPNLAAARWIAILLFFFVGRSHAEWTDPSKHIVRFIEVERGVKLEVLDWGGHGEPIILLAGHGDTGHIFDDFAPSLIDHFRVLAITRRGFGGSSQPDHGYNLNRMVEDIAKVTKALKLGPVDLVGHSIAGDELTRFAISHPAQVRKLVYLEAAYDRVDAQRLESHFPKIPPSPSSARESGSPEAIRALVESTEIAMPEAEIRATRVFGPDGQFVRAVTPDSIVHSVAVMVEHPEYEKLKAPVLAIYAVYTSPEQLVPRHKTADLPTRQAIDQIFDMWQPFAKAQRNLLRSSLPQAQIVEIAGGNHYIFISNHQTVTEAVERFLSRP